MSDFLEILSKANSIQIHSTPKKIFRNSSTAEDVVQKNILKNSSASQKNNKSSNSLALNQYFWSGKNI
jgi:hypothetical protein